MVSWFDCAVHPAAAGHAPLPVASGSANTGALGSHTSGGSTTPLPQLGVQLLSFNALHIGGQLWSLFAQPVMVPPSAPASPALTHSRWQPVPFRTNSAQPWFGQVVGHGVPAPASPVPSSHFSPDSRTPLPQKGMQSGSLVE